MAEEKKIYTTGFGAPVDNDQNSKTAGNPGPILMQDTHLLEKLGHFDRERIPERVVHAKGAGAHGYFEVTADVTKYTKAKFLSAIGKKTDVFARFSTVGGERCEKGKTTSGDVPERGGESYILGRKYDRIVTLTWVF